MHAPNVLNLLGRISLRNTKTAMQKCVRRKYDRFCKGHLHLQDNLSPDRPFTICVDQIRMVGM